MLSNAHLLFKFMMLAGDFLAIVLAFVLAYILRVTLGIDAGSYSSDVVSAGSMSYLFAFLTTMPLWLITLASLGLYGNQTYYSRYSEFGRLFIGTLIGILAVIGFEFFTNQSILPGRLIAIYGFILSFLLLMIDRQIIRIIRKQLFKYGRGMTRLMIIGSNPATKNLTDLLKDSQTSGYHISAVVGSKKYLPSGFGGKHFSSLNDALDSIEDLEVTMIIQTELFESKQKNNKILQVAAANHIAYRLIPAQQGLFTGNHSVDLFHGYPVVAVHQTALVGWGRIAKRIFDIIVSAALIVLFSPIMLVTAIFMLIKEGRPIIFKQKRITRHNKQVYVYKFRSMKKQFSGRDQEKAFREVGRDDLAEQYLKKGHQQVDFGDEDDIRITQFGKFIRKTSIDELPQLFNVVKGDISLVGPRVIVPEELKFFKELGPQMLYVKTGITGLAQVSGRSDITLEERANINSYYVRNWTFWLDIKILLKTGLIIVKGNNTK